MTGEKENKKVSFNGIKVKLVLQIFAKQNSVIAQVFCVGVNVTNTDADFNIHNILAHL